MFVTFEDEPIDIFSDEFAEDLYDFMADKEIPEDMSMAEWCYEAYYAEFWSFLCDRYPNLDLA